MILSLYEKFRPWSQKGSVYIFSDPHFADSDCKIMDPNWISPAEQVDRINKLVYPTDTLIILGDIGDVSYVSKLRGYKVLIMGNHDTGADNYKRKVSLVNANYTREEATDAIKNNVIDFVKADDSEHGWLGYKDNHLFDEVYEGPLFIGEKILLSHEPVFLPYVLNIHGHDHNGVLSCPEGCHHINVAANVCGYTPVNLGKLIKKGALSKVPSIHRITIDDAVERKSKRLADKAADERGL